MSGYPSVVGALCQINDEYSAEVARDVYVWMLNHSGGAAHANLGIGIF